MASIDAWHLTSLILSQTITNKSYEKMTVTDSNSGVTAACSQKTNLHLGSRVIEDPLWHFRGNAEGLV
ncbi:hypothetical protein DPEC_G00233990 [Dallia pectoralis]|uniref:Uncharacterized protein n=1 Tax=Dallia pectoralis TaxID=75939 RepID=A0ACC2FXW3_DALPE|nr:hypothetical protein DPEC_G00233990 [Dallia pectoralis]